MCRYVLCTDSTVYCTVSSAVYQLIIVGFDSAIPLPPSLSPGAGERSSKSDWRRRMRRRRLLWMKCGHSPGRTSPTGTVAMTTKSDRPRTLIGIYMVWYIGSGAREITFSGSVIVMQCNIFNTVSSLCLSLSSRYTDKQRRCSLKSVMRTSPGTSGREWPGSATSTPSTARTPKTSAACAPSSCS